MKRIPATALGRTIRCAALAASVSVLGASAAHAAGTPVAMALGDGFSCALASEGWVKCWGLNDTGQLGDGTTTNSALPVRVVGLGPRNEVVAIGAGRAHACAVTTRGAVRCWGANDHGQLGDGTIRKRLTPVNVIGLNAAIVAVSPGLDHTCVLTSTGGVECWGRNDSWQLGDGGRNRDRHTPVDVVGLSSGVIKIAAGDGHTCALTSAGGVKCWGYNRYGQLGDGTELTRPTPVDVSGLTSGVAAITAGELHTCALLVSGGAKCWGYNFAYEVGHGRNTNPRLVPIDVLGLSGATGISARYDHTCTALQRGGAKCWGANNDGQLGDGTQTNQPHAVRVRGLRDVSAISAGLEHTCAIFQTNAMRCWGDNNDGELGNGETGVTDQSPVRVKRF